MIASKWAMITQFALSNITEVTAVFGSHQIVKALSGNIGIGDLSCQRSKDDFIDFIVGKLASGNITNQPSVTLCGFKLGNDGKGAIDGQGSNFRGPFATAASFTEQKSDANGLYNADDGEKASGGS